MFGNKVSDYLEAGLPVIATKSLPFVCEIVHDYEIGAVVENYRSIPVLVKHVGYDKFKVMTLLNRNKFTINAHKDELIDFLENV